MIERLHMEEMGAEVAEVAILRGRLISPDGLPLVARDQGERSLAKRKNHAQGTPVAGAQNPLGSCTRKTDPFAGESRVRRVGSLGSSRVGGRA
jgi:hypothetical protein